MFFKDGLVCDRKRIQGKDHLVPLEPQPSASCVRHVTRYDYKLKRCDTYSKRITVVVGSPIYLCEYLGTMPVDCVSHGNCKQEGTQYVRTRPAVTQAIRQQCRESKHNPKKIFDTMTSTAAEESECPRNLKQVQNASVEVNEQLRDKNLRGTNNLADEMLTLCSMVKDNDFVRTVTFNSEHAPCAILYTKEQLADVKRFCGADAPDNVRRVLCVDRTFNVSSLFLTLTVFKNMSVVHSSTRQPPIFLGPMFLHGDGAFVSYLTFFMSMRGALDSDVHATEHRYAS